MSIGDFARFARSAGLRPGAIVPDGKWRRCPTDDHPRTKNGSYKLATDGLVGWVMDFATHDAPLIWRPEKVFVSPPVDAATIARRMAQDQRSRDEATRGARAYYERASTLIGGHPYLESHGLDMAGCRGLKIDAHNWLVVPATKGRELVTVQRIATCGEKRFWAGAPVKGASYIIERPNAPVTVMVEGLATGLAIYAAAPLTRVVVCFDSGNLPRVAESLTVQGMVCIAGDNDHATETRTGRNPGLEAARHAAELLGCEVAAPTGITGTDWCDYRNERREALLASRSYGSRVSEREVGRTVDAEVAGAIARAARLVSRKGAA